VVVITFTPAATGARPATLTFTDNSGGVAGSTQQVVLNGTSTLAPANIAVTGGTPQSTTVGTAFAAPLAVTVSDVNNVPVSGVTVTFTAPNPGPSGTFAGGVDTAVTNANGVATSVVFTANSIAGSYTVNATVPGLDSSATFSLTNDNPVPTLTAISPTSGIVGQSVMLTLTGNNFVSGAVVNFGANADGGGVESNGTSITITIPAAQLSAAGPVNVTVTNPAPTAGPSAAQVFTVNGAGLVIGVNGNVTVPSTSYSFSFPVQSVGGLGGTLNSFCASATVSCLISPCPTNLKANGSVLMTVTLYSTPQAAGIFEPELPGVPGLRVTCPHFPRTGSYDGTMVLSS
jgi:hypothetical protein